MMAVPAPMPCGGHALRNSLATGHPKKMNTPNVSRYAPNREIFPSQESSSQPSIFMEQMCLSLQ